MNSIEQLKQDVERVFPEIHAKLRRPRNPDGVWWLDLEESGRTVIVQWSSSRGFGVSASDLADGYGEGADEVFDERPAARKRVLELLRTGGQTAPPRDVVLRELRAQLGVTQEQLAERLGVKQAAVSKLERRPEITLASLKRYVAALGGELEINVRTPSGDSIRLLEPRIPRARRAACAHVERRLSATTPLNAISGTWATGKSSGHLRGLLAWCEAEVRTQWRLSRPALVLEHCADGLASSWLDTGAVAVEDGTESRAADALAATVMRQLGCDQGRARDAVFGYLVAHEVGHFVERTELAAEPAFSHLRHPELQADAVAGWLGARAGDEPALGAAVASILGCEEESCQHPAPTARVLAYLRGHGEGVRLRSSDVRLVSLVIRARDIERSRSFYEHLGLRWKPEQHGRGPRHYSCVLADTVLELYPCVRDESRGEPLRLGLRRPAAAGELDRLKAVGVLASDARAVRTDGSSSVYLLRDPDENVVEMTLQAA